MAGASKTPQRPAPAAKAAAGKPAPARPGAKPASAKPAVARSGSPAATSAPSAPGNGLRATLWILVLAAITGLAPVALAGQALGYWNIPISVPGAPFLSSAPVYDAPLAKPLAMVVGSTAHVVAVPGDSAIVASLEPGFPVTVTRYATQGGARWAQVKWAGPVKAAGGSGWALAARLQNPGGGGAKPIGDLGALAPAVGRAASQAGSGFAATLYFPGSGYAYHSASAGQTVALGGQIAPIVLVADYGEGLATKQPSSINQDLANGNPQALTFVFHAVGADKGLSDYMAHYHITGFSFTPDPAKASATVQGLGQFYTALTQAPLASAGDQRQIFALLNGANTAGGYASPSQVGSGALTVTTEQTAKGYTTILTGALQPANGPALTLVVVAADQPTSATSQDAVKLFLTSLFTTLG